LVTKFINLGQINDPKNGDIEVSFGCGNECPIIFNSGTNQIEIPADVQTGNYTISIELEDKNDLSREISFHKIKM